MVTETLTMAEVKPDSAAEAAAKTVAKGKPKRSAGLGSILRLYLLLRGLLTRSEKFALLSIFGGMLLSAIADAGSIAGLSAYTSVISNPTKLDSWSWSRRLPEMGIEKIALLGGVALIGVFLIKFLINTALVWQRSKFAERLRVRLSTALFQRYMNAPWEFHLNHNSAELLRNVNGEVNQVTSQVVTPLLNLSLSYVQTTAILFVLFVSADVEGLIPLVPVAILLGVFLKMTRHRLVVYGKKVQRERKEAIRAVREGLGSLPESTILGKIDFVLNRYEKLLKSFSRVQRKSLFINGVTTPLIETAVVAALIAVIVVLLIFGRTMAEVGPLIVLMAAASMRLKSSLVAISTANHQLRYSQASLELVSGEMKHKSLRKREEVIDPAQQMSWQKLRFDDVSHRYLNADADSLRNISLTISRGDRVGIIGGSGAGKSTLVALLLGLLDPTKGSISIDGVPLRKLKGSWQQLIGYVPQSVFIADDTIRANIAFGESPKQVDEARLAQAVAMAQIEADLAKMPLGLATVAGEGGCRVSGGQRQRIGLARALYRMPELLILDEATSALDPATESSFVESIRQLSDDATVISISHRYSALRGCGSVIELSGGILLRDGSFSELCGQELS